MDQESYEAAIAFVGALNCEDLQVQVDKLNKLPFLPETDDLAERLNRVREHNYGVRCRQEWHRRCRPVGAFVDMPGCNCVIGRDTPGPHHGPHCPMKIWD